MINQVYRRSCILPVSQQTLFEWHERPDAFELLTPPWRKVAIVERSEGALEKGYWQIMRIALPIGSHDWKAVITECQPPHYFVDEQEYGPFAYWHHRHEMHARGPNESELVDEITYALPGGRFGQWMLGWYIRRDLERLFTYRHAQMKKQFS